MSLLQAQEKDNRFGLASVVEAAETDLNPGEESGALAISSRSRARPQSLGAPSRRRSRSRRLSRSRSRSRSRRRHLSRSRSKSRSHTFRRRLSRSRSRTRIPANSQNDAFRAHPGDHSAQDTGGGPHITPRPSMSSLKSRARSRSRSPDASAHAHPKITFAEETQKRPKYGRVPASSREVPDLDRDDPGDWVIRHHRSGLVVRLEEYIPNKIQSILDGMKEMLQNVPGLGESKEKTKKEENLAVATAPSENTSSEAAPTKVKKPLDNKRFRISFAEVQRMKIRKIQCQLVRHVVKMRYDGHESPGWEDTLEQYIKALQDHDYMEKRSKSIRDPFLATGEFSIDNYILNSNINTILANDPTIEPASSIFPWEPHDSTDPSRRFEPICGTRSDNIARTWYLGFKDRILLAALGGAFLIGPMWLMVLHNGEFTGLIATTGFVAVFGTTLWLIFLKREKMCWPALRPMPLSWLCLWGRVPLLRLLSLLDESRVYARDAIAPLGMSSGVFMSFSSSLPFG